MRNVVLAIAGLCFFVVPNHDAARGALASQLNPSPAPVIASVSPAPGVVSALNTISVTFSEPVAGVEADDLMINGVPPVALSAQGNTYTFSFAQPLYGTVLIDWVEGHGITDFDTPANAFDSRAPEATWRYELIDTTAPTILSLHPPPGASIAGLSQIEVAFSEDVIGVRASDLLVNGRAAAEVSQRPGGPFIFKFATQPLGPITVTWASNHAITDTALPPNAFAGGLWSYQVEPAEARDVVITEILAANVRGGLRDEDGELQDWIELRNRGSKPVNLANWSLSDDPDLPGLWTFPARTLAPGEYLIVFASGKDRKPADRSGRLHTNFKLADAGEHLGLYSPDSPRLFVSGFTAFPEQRNDISYGIDAGGNLRYFTNPTPGQANGFSTVTGICAPVHVNVERGHFNTPFDLILSCATPDVVFRYTLDGSEPTSISPVFQFSMRIARTTLFRAAAFKENHLPSKTVTHSYLFNLPANIRSLPVISIVTATNHLYGRTGILGINGGHYRNGPWSPNPGATNDYHNPSKHGLAWERPASVEWIRPADNAGFQVDCGIRVQGSDYQRPRLTRFSKFSFRLYFRGDYGPGRLEYPLFPLTNVRRFDQLVLRAGFNEQGNPFIRDEIHRRLSRDMGQVASHGALAVVLVNGVYYAASPWYNPCERVHEEFLQEHLGGGNEWDVVGPSFATSAGATGVIDGDRANFQGLVNYVRTQPVTNPAVYLEIERRLDLTNFVDYCLLNAYAAMGDWPANNWRAGRERSPNGIWRFIVWDAEWGMGIYDRTSSINTFTQSGGGPNDSGLASVGSSEIARIYDRLRASPEFRLLWADRVHKHFFNGGALTGGNITNRFEELRREMLLLIPNMEREILQWARDRQNIFFRHMQPYGLVLSSNAPVFSQFGGRVARGFQLAMTNLQGTIYYTLDGADPRTRFTGVPSPTASAYARPVPLSASVTVKARTLQGTNWSALAEAKFSVDSLGVPLRLSEIMFNPPGGAPYEFIELENTSETEIDLSEIYFAGIDFVFRLGSKLAPRARLVLASNTDPNGWKSRYPSAAVFGWFGGSLSDAGERLALFDRNGAVITSVDYKPNDGWPAAANGGGRSLQVIDPLGDPNDPANWHASLVVNGTPGAAFSTPPKPVISLNEVMAENRSAIRHGGSFPDWIEIANTSEREVNLGGWSLTDDGNPRKFVFPPGTVIAPSGYLVVWCDTSNSQAPGLFAGFKLDRDGESVSLYDHAGNRVDAVSFGPQVADRSIGRLNGEWVLTMPTPNAVNVRAALAPATQLHINEWMANPAPGGEDWIELFNASGELPLALRGFYLGTSHSVHRIQSLSFLPPRGCVQLLADKRPGPLHLDFTLPAAGGAIFLHDTTGGELQRVVYSAQTTGVSQGRLPDGTASIVSFDKTPSPGARNYSALTTGPVLSEVLARNRSVIVGGGIADFVEIHNPTAAALDLSGMSVSADRREPGQWVFPTGSVLAPGAFLVIACDGTRRASSVPGALNLGSALDGESGGVYLFNTAGELVDALEYGFQIEDLPLGKVAGQWRLLQAATPGNSNAPAAALGTNAGLRLNEWMAAPETGPDWFELFNASDRPVDLSTVSLTDDPSLAGRGKFRPAALSFIAPSGFVKWVADGNPGQGRNHVNFRLDAAGDTLFVHHVAGAAFSLIDAVAWGTQMPGVSEGSWPDGANTLVAFPQSATPGAANTLATVDSDRDGIPDPAELALGLDPQQAADARLDHDADGVSTGDEYFAGTDPRDASSFLRLDRISASGPVVISFQAAANRSYSVFSTESFTNPLWRKLVTVPARPIAQSITVTDGESGLPMRFYRLVTPAERF